MGSEASCKGCGCQIVWDKDEKGRRVPRDPSGRDHRRTCPSRVKHRKRGRKGHPIGEARG